MRVITKVEDFRRVAKEAEQAKIIYFDWESSGLDVYTMTMFILALKFDNKETYVIDIRQGIEEYLDLLKPALENPNIVKVAHNFVFDYKLFFHKGIDVKNGYCTMVTEQLLVSGLRDLSCSLAAVALRRLKVPLDKSIREGFIGRTEYTFTQAEYEYAGMDVEVLPAIREQQLREIRMEEMERVHALEMQLLPVTGQMEYAGIDVDLDKVERAIPEFEAVIRKSTHAMQDAVINAGIADRIFFSRDGYIAVKPSSPKQMLDAMRAMGIDVESTDAKELVIWDGRWAIDQAKKGTKFLTLSDTAVEIEDDINVGYNHPFLRLHAARSAAEKTLGTYLLAIKSHVNPVTKKLHPNFNQCGAAATGRYSSSKINFQNIIKKRKLDQIGLGEYDVRSMFIPGEGYKFITCDYESIELVILAALSQDQVLIEQIQKGDIHSFVGSAIFGIQFDKKMAKEEPYATYRDVAKTITYAIMYGTGGRNLYRRLSLSLLLAGFTMKPDMGDLWIKQWYEMFPKTSALLTKNGNKAVTKLYTTSILGRRRHWSYDMLRTKGQMFAAMREGKNAPIQSSSADLTKTAELLLAAELDPTEAWLIASIHDELIIRVKDEHVDKYASRIKWAMEKAGADLFPMLPEGMITVEPSIVTFYSK
jgi:DNA polymerase-1